jgi:hypothetical protein
MRKTTLSVIVSALALAFLSLPASAAWLPSDAAGHWAAAEISAALDQGYVTGYPDGTIRPEANVTRAEFAALVNRAKGYYYDGPANFDDVSYGDWHYADVAAAAYYGYMAGDGNGKFRPDANITREEAAVVFAKVNAGGNPYYDISTLADAHEISLWALPSVKSAFSRNMFKDGPYGTFSPKAAMKRGEVIKAVNAMAGIVAGSSSSSPSQTLPAISRLALDRTGSGTLSVSFSAYGERLYWVIVPYGSGAPTAAQIAAGTDGNGRVAEASGNTLVANGRFTATGLSDTQSYELYAVSRNTGSPHPQSPVSSRTFRLYGINGDYATELSGITNVRIERQSSGRLRTLFSAYGERLYWVVALHGTSAPAVSQITAGTDGNGRVAAASGSTLAANGEFTATGLSDSQRYDLYMVSGNGAYSYSPVLSRTFRLSDLGSSSGYYGSPSLTYLYANDAGSYGSINLSARSDKSGTLYCTVLGPENSAYGGNALDIRNGKDGAGRYAEHYGSFRVRADETEDFTITGLSSYTSYTVYACVWDDDDRYSNILSRSVYTDGNGYWHGDGTNVLGGISHASAEASGENTAILSARAYNAGAVSYTVSATNTGRPSAADVIAGKNSLGESVKSGNFRVYSSGGTGSAEITGLAPGTTYYVCIASETSSGQAYGPVEFTTATAANHKLLSVSFVADGYARTITSFSGAPITVPNIPSFVTGFDFTANYETNDGNKAVVRYSFGDTEYVHPIISGTPLYIGGLSAGNDRVTLTVNGDVYTFVLSFAE